MSWLALVRRKRWYVIGVLVLSVLALSTWYNVNQYVPRLIAMLGNKHTTGEHVYEPWFGTRYYTDADAVRKLGELKDPRATGPLIDAALRGGADVTSAAAVALRELAPDLAVQRFTAGLGDPSPVRRSFAALALGQLRHPAAVTSLIGAALRDSDSAVRLEAGRALFGLNDQQVVPRLVDASVRDPEEGIREAGIEALGRVKAASTVTALASALEDPDSNVQRAAAKALGAVGDGRAVAPLASALESSDTDVRRTGALALGQLKVPAAVAALVAAAAHDSQETVRDAAVAALADTDWPTGNAALVATIKEIDLRVIAGRYRELIRIGDPRLEEPLVAALDQHGSRFMAVAYLNCGNEVLAKHARQWAKSRGYTVTAWPSSVGPGSVWKR
jgi:HEAT repeat protein